MRYLVYEYPFTAAERLVAKTANYDLAQIIKEELSKQLIGPEAAKVAIIEQTALKRELRE